jgi:hypothetical protein
MVVVFPAVTVKFALAPVATSLMVCAPGANGNRRMPVLPTANTGSPSIWNWALPGWHPFCACGCGTPSTEMTVPLSPLAQKNLSSLTSPDSKLRTKMAVSLPVSTRKVVVAPVASSLSV